MASHRSTGIICLGFWLNEGGVEFGAHPLVNGTTHVLKAQPATAIVENLSISQTRGEHLLLNNVLVSTIQSVYEYLDQWTEKVFCYHFWGFVVFDLAMLIDQFIS